MNAALPPRSREVLERVQAGQSAAQIAAELETSRNAVYQQITKLRREGYLPPERPTGNGSDATVQHAVEQFKSQLTVTLRKLDAHEKQLRDELARVEQEKAEAQEQLDRIS
jgi:predicted ArsR family transcriptional regulator